MAFEDMDLNDTINLDSPPPEERSNRPFLIVAGILVALTLIFLICIAGYALWYVPQTRAQQTAAVEEIYAQNTEMAKIIIETSIAEAFTATPTVTSTGLPSTMEPTNTPVVVIQTNTLVPTGDPRTATVAALFTQAAQAQATVAPSATTTALPATGFADEVGAPGLIGMAFLLLVVIFFVRRLRTTG